MNIHFIFCTNKAKHKYNFERKNFPSFSPGSGTGCRQKFRIQPDPNSQNCWKLWYAVYWSEHVCVCVSEAQGKEGTFKGYKLMTSVSIPVYNKKNHTVGQLDYFTYFYLYIYLYSVFRIRIHWTRIRIQPKISIRIQKTPESGSGTLLL